MNRCTDAAADTPVNIGEGARRLEASDEHLGQVDARVTLRDAPEQVVVLAERIPVAVAANAPSALVRIMHVGWLKAPR
jgi:hypothetical protein